MYYIKIMYVYIINEWTELFDYGGLVIIMAKSDEECIYLCQRRGSKYQTLSYEDTTPEIREELRNDKYTSTDVITDIVVKAKRIPVGERRWDDNNALSLAEFVEKYGGLEEWYTSEIVIEQSGIIDSFSV